MKSNYSSSPTISAGSSRSSAVERISNLQKEYENKYQDNGNEDEIRHAASGWSCLCKLCCVCVTCLLLLAATGGILLWKLMPEQDRSDLSALASNGATPQLPGPDDKPPPYNYTFNQCAPDKADDCCNGVDSICDLSADRIMFASLHNAYADAQDGFRVARNHDYRLEFALERGFRGLSLDVGICDGKLVFIHTKCILGQRDPLTVFQHINNFLNDNPREVLLISFEINNDAGGIVNIDDLYNIMSKVDGFTNRLVKHTNDTLPWPTLRSMIDTDQRIMMFQYNGIPCNETLFGCPPGIYDYFHYAAENGFEYQTPADMLNASSTCLAPRGAKGLVNFFGLNVFMIIPSETDSAEINTKAWLENQIKMCTDFYDNYVDINLINIDFWHLGDLVEVVQEYNKQLGASYLAKLNNTTTTGSRRLSNIATRRLNNHVKDVQ